MKTSNPDVSICRRCQYYKAEGRRGGYCQRLCAEVRGSWKACSLAIPPFGSNWEPPSGIMDWHPKAGQPTPFLGDGSEADVERTIEVIRTADIKC